MNPAKHTAMMRAFDAFSKRISSRYDEARECLSQGKYEEAQNILASLSVSHAKTSMSLRGFMIREGLIGDEDK